jgi:hypothetical protein
MRLSISIACGLALALAGPIAACQAQGLRIPTLTQQQVSHMLPSQLPTVYRDAEPPYEIHETDGLSRNPDDCIKWGCIDVNGR